MCCALFVSIADLCVLAWFWISENLIGEIFPGTSSIERCVLRVFTIELTVIVWRLGCANEYSSDGDKSDIRWQWPVKCQHWFSRWRSACQAILPYDWASDYDTSSPTVKLLCFQGTGIMAISAHLNLVELQSSMRTWVLVNVLPGMTFYVYLAKLMDKPIILRSFVIVVPTSSASTSVVQVCDDKPSLPELKPQSPMQRHKNEEESSIRVLHYRPLPLQGDHSERHMGVVNLGKYTALHKWFLERWNSSGACEITNWAWLIFRAAKSDWEDRLPTQALSPILRKDRSHGIPKRGNEPNALHDSYQNRLAWVATTNSAGFHEILNSTIWHRLWKI